MATSNKNFRIKNGLDVLGTSATVDGKDILTTGSSINSLSDVDTTTKSNNDALVYNQTTQKWEPKPPATAFGTIATPSGTSPVADSASDTLTLTAGTGITITGDSVNDSVQIGTTGLASETHTHTAGDLPNLQDLNGTLDVASGGTGATSAKAARANLVTPTMVAGTTPPSAENSNPGDIWLNSTDGSLYAYYQDANSSQWVQVGSAAGLQGEVGPQGPAGPQGPSGVSTIAEATDTTIVSPSNNHILAYNSGTSKWENKSETDAGIAKLDSPAFSGTVTAPTLSSSSVLVTGDGTNPPLDINSSTLTSTLYEGAIENSNGFFYATPNTSLGRGALSVTHFVSGVGISGIGANTNYALFPAPSDTITLPVGTYYIQMNFTVTVATSTVSTALNLNIRGAGTAGGSLSWTGSGGTRTASLPTLYSNHAVALGTAMTVAPVSATAGRVYTVSGNGLLRVTSSGTIIPSYQFPTSPTSGAVTLATNNFLTIQRIGATGTTVFTGAWS